MRIARRLQAGLVLLGGISVLGIAAYALNGEAEEADSPTVTYEPLDCVTRDAADNPMRTSPDGRPITMPLTLPFDTIEEAQDFLCLEIPKPYMLGDWRVAYVHASRSRPLAQYDAQTGIADRRVNVGFRHESLRQGFELWITGADGAPSEHPGQPEMIRINGVEAQVWVSDDPSPQFLIEWETEAYRIWAQGGGDLQPDDIVTLLASIK